MSACLKCQSQSTTFKQGTGKNGKPYKAYKCDDCGEMNWVNSFPKSQAQGKPAQASLEKKVDKILAILVKNFGNVVVKEDEEKSPF